MVGRGRSGREGRLGTGRLEGRMLEGRWMLEWAGWEVRVKYKPRKMARRGRRMWGWRWNRWIWRVR